MFSLLINFIYLLGVILAIILICITYRWLWSSLINLSKLANYKMDILLIRLSLTLSLAFIVLICIFGFIYLLLTLLDYPINQNYLIHQKTGELVNLNQINIFFYFSAVTYFSLGYGDYVPAGTFMHLVIIIESLLGYINSGLIIAFAFEIFKRQTLK